jgi:hypothetical protein
MRNLWSVGLLFIAGVCVANCAGTKTCTESCGDDGDCSGNTYSCLTLKSGAKECLPKECAPCPDTCDYDVEQWTSGNVCYVGTPACK